MLTRENIALFDRYLSGSMDTTEKQAFEERLYHSEQLKKAFDTYQSVGKTIEESVGYDQIREQLNTIHEELYPAKKTIKLQKKWLIPLGIAASIALFIFIFPMYGESSKSDMAYQELSNDNGAENTAKQEEEIHPGYFNHFSDSISLKNGLPRGTAFLIHEEGYFLTARHLVDDTVLILQQRKQNLIFEATVVYTDSLADFALLKAPAQFAAHFSTPPYQLLNTPPLLGETIFALGYPKKDIVYTAGNVSSENGFQSDSLTMELSLPSNAGNSGAPVFNERGNIAGMITGNNTRQQMVTYALKPTTIAVALQKVDSLPVQSWFGASIKRRPIHERVAIYRQFVFEVH